VVEHDLAAGSRTILITYGDSLHSVLSEREIGSLLSTVVHQVRGRAMVVAADGRWATHQEVAFAREAAASGADVLMVLAPDWGASATEASFVAHYRAVARELPIMLVTAAFAGREAVGVEVVERLRDTEPRFVALKDDLCGETGRRIATILRNAVPFLSGGQKQNHLDVLPYGSDGYLSTFLQFRPSVAHTYWAAVVADDMAAARDVVERVDRPFFDAALAQPGGFDAAIRGALQLAGVAPRWRRPPYHDLTDAELEGWAETLAGLGLLDG